MKKFKKSTIVPCALVLYLAFMAYYSRAMLTNGEHWRYYGTLAATLVIIALVHICLRRKERMQNKADDEDYTTYQEAEKRAKANSEKK